MSSSTSTQFPDLSLSSQLTREATSARRAREGLSDEQLLELVKGSNRDALALLFKRYSASIHSVGRRILRDRSEADDLVQEVFLYLHHKCVLFDGSKGSARSWIFQVAYTQALLKRRELKSLGFYVSGIADKQGEINNVGIRTGADYDQTVEGVFGRNGWKRIIDDLTEDQYETLRLHFFEGLTFTEIAAKLSQSYAGVRHHHYRALEKLRKHLAAGELSRR